MNITRTRARLRLRVNELPVLPHAIVKLMGLERESPDYFDQLLEILEIEPNFAARVLILANSAAIGSQTPVTSIRDALTRVGSAGVSNLVLAMAVTRVFVPRDDWERNMWSHAFLVATASRELASLAQSPNLTPETAYLCGLLHDIGRFVMMQEDPDTLRRVDEGDWNDPLSLVALEKSICGLDHADLGAQICEGWKLPEVVTESVRRHHQEPRTSGNQQVDEACTIVRLADILMFPSALPGETTATPDLQAILADPHGQKGFQPTLPQLSEVVQTTMQAAKRLHRTLGLG